MDYLLETMPIPKQDDIIIFKFNPEELTYDEVIGRYTYVSDYFPNNFVLALPSGADTEVLNKEETIQILNNYIEKLTAQDKTD